MPTTLPGPTGQGTEFRFVAVDAAGREWRWIDDEMVWARIDGGIGGGVRAGPDSCPAALTGRAWREPGLGNTTACPSVRRRGKRGGRVWVSPGRRRAEWRHHFGPPYHALSARRGHRRTADRRM